MGSEGQSPRAGRVHLQHRAAAFALKVQRRHGFMAL